MYGHEGQVLEVYCTVPIYIRSGVTGRACVEVLGDDENGSDDVVVFGGGDGRSEGMMRGVWQGWPVISIRMAHQALLRSNRFGVTVTSFSG